ncbi:hypothetical protein [Sinorhizobium fredii]|uniref:hypothetical protein n=1 Tax=Rhizobium fredii TaxID=380 RepID=UPI0012FE0549|nr:hypothetical protein [Sinorhizobium fredii]
MTQATLGCHAPVTTQTPVGDATTDRGGLWPGAQQDGICIAALHKIRFPNDQKTIMMHSVNANGINKDEHTSAGASAPKSVRAQLDRLTR